MQCTLQGHGGSPPRMRGRASAWLPVLRPPKDHPRVCGEEIDRQGHHADDWGSPPRMRGRGPQRGPGRGAPGITPACAGKSLKLLLSAFRLQDHPRVCGEKKEGAPGRVPPLGSPPRVRGKAPVRSSPALHSGITPACAGKSYRQIVVCAHCPGITPACAGKRPRAAQHWTTFQDHPRVCGEKSIVWPSSGPVTGSPPRVRGKGHTDTPIVRDIGITPACAGKRLKKFHSIGHFSCILCLFHSVLHRASASGGSRAGPCAPPCLPAQNAVPV